MIALVLRKPGTVACCSLGINEYLCETYKKPVFKVYSTVLYAGGSGVLQLLIRYYS